MEIQPAFNSGLQGIQQANQNLDKTAFDIANTGNQTANNPNQSSGFSFNSQTLPDLSESIIDLKVAEYQAKSSANVIKSADEALGTILDIRV